MTDQEGFREVSTYRQRGSLVSVLVKELDEGRLLAKHEVIGMYAVTADDMDRGIKDVRYTEYGKELAKRLKVSLPDADR